MSAYDAGVLTSSRAMSDYYEHVARESGADPKIAANWIAVELSGFLNKDNKEIEESRVTAGMMSGLLKRLVDNTISGKIAKEVLEAMWAGEGDADTVIEKKGLKQITDSGAIEKIAQFLHRFRSEGANLARQAIGERRVGGRHSRRIDHYAGVRNRSNPEEIVGLIPDDVEIAGDTLQEIEPRLAALAILQRREIGGRNVQRPGHVLLADAALAADLADRFAEGRGHSSPPLTRASRT